MNILTKPISSITAGSIDVLNFPTSQPVSMESLPLPTGAATASKQDAIIDKISNKDIMMALKLLIQTISTPAWLDKSTNLIRTQVAATLSSVGTVTSITQVNYPWAKDPGASEKSEA